MNIEKVYKLSHQSLALVQWLTGGFALLFYRLHLQTLLLPHIPAPTSPKWILSQQEGRLKAISPLFLLSWHTLSAELVSVYRGLQNDLFMFYSSITVFTDLTALTLTVCFPCRLDVLLPFRCGVVWSITPRFGLCFISRLRRIDGNSCAGYVAVQCRNKLIVKNIRAEMKTSLSGVVSVWQFFCLDLAHCRSRLLHFSIYRRANTDTWRTFPPWMHTLSSSKPNEWTLMWPPRRN